MNSGMANAEKIGNHGIHEQTHKHEHKHSTLKVESKSAKKLEKGKLGFRGAPKSLLL